MIASKQSSRSPSLSQVNHSDGEALTRTAVPVSPSLPRSDGSDGGVLGASAPRPFSPASSQSRSRRSSQHGGSAGGRSSSPCDKVQNVTATEGVGDQLQRAISQRLDQAKAARAGAIARQEVSEPDDEDDEDLSGHESFPESDKSSDAWG